MNKSLIVDLKDVDFKSEQDVAEFMAKQLEHDTPRDGPQWQLFLKENYLDGKSLMVLRMQHVVTDGYGVVGIMQCLSDDADK